MRKPTEHEITTFKDVFNEEIDRNGREYPDINKNCRYWLSMLPAILEFDPSVYSDVCFPQWFEKCHAETMLGRALTITEWNDIRDNAPDWLADAISEQFAIALNEWEANQ